VFLILVLPIRRARSTSRTAATSTGTYVLCRRFETDNVLAIFAESCSPLGDRLKGTRPPHICKMSLVCRSEDYSSYRKKIIPQSIFGVRFPAPVSKQDCITEQLHPRILFFKIRLEQTLCAR
jgi:hypothetical protein